MDGFFKVVLDVFFLLIIVIVYLWFIIWMIKWLWFISLGRLKCCGENDIEVLIEVKLYNCCFV